jgi:hypothetical protein
MSASPRDSQGDRLVVVIQRTSSAAIRKLPIMLSVDPTKGQVSVAARGLCDCVKVNLALMPALSLSPFTQ